MAKVDNKGQENEELGEVEKGKGTVRKARVGRREEEG